MATLSAPDHNGGRNDRLNGWKEIALHFGKGVRTVQRWEKDLGLPVRRLGTGRGEIVFAFKSELEAWRQAVERGGNLSSTPAEDDPTDLRDEVQAQPPDLSAFAPTSPAPSLSHAAPSASRSLPPFSLRRFRPAVIASVFFLLAAIGVLAWWMVHRAVSQPYEARVENHALRVYDENGRFLWEKRFEFPLMETALVQTARVNRPSELVADVDGDGRREVLFATLYEPIGTPGGVFCFNDRGELRFRHVFQGVASYGSLPYTGPWHPVALTVAAETDGTKAVWVAFEDRDQFPTVIQKVSASGTALGSFWHAGTLEVLQPGEFRGRKVVFAGGNSNEFSGAALAVIDRQSPTGRSPAITPKFLCAACPGSPPLDYLVFPGTELEREQQNTSAVTTIRQGEQGQFTLSVTHALYPGLRGRNTGPILGYTTYVFTPQLLPLVAHHEPSYRVLHDEAYKLGILDHPFREAEDQALRVLRWNGSAFEEMSLPPRH